MNIDFRKAMLASFLTIGLGIVLSILSMILQLLSVLITGEIGNYVDIIYVVYQLLMFPVFFGLLLWTGMRAVRRFGYDAVGAGYITAFAFFVIGLIERILQMLLAIIEVRGPIEAVGFGSTEMVVASSIFGGLIGLSGVALSTVCGFGLVLFGSMVNFVVGGFGALVEFSRQRSG